MVQESGASVWSQSRCGGPGGVWGDKYPETLAAAKVGLGFLCKAYPDQFTTRTFEVPAAGTALLAERTAEHLEIFEEGVEAEFFEGPVEFKQKLQDLLCDEERRIEIAKSGQKRVLNDYTWDETMKE